MLHRLENKEAAANPFRDEKRTASKQVLTRKVERQYAASLRAVAKHVGHLIKGIDLAGPGAVPTVTQMLRAYSEALGEWATATAGRMLNAVDQQDRTMWARNGETLSRELRDQLRNAPTGETMRALMAEQVTLIKSIPLDAAQRVHDLTITGLEDSTRASEIAKEIMRSGEVAENRATLIARTEVARSASKLTETRAKAAGSDGYIWRTSGDRDVRSSHKSMNGKFVPWDKPPTLSDGTTTHAGQIFNCRCYPEPVLPDLQE